MKKINLLITLLLYVCYTNAQQIFIHEPELKPPYSMGLYDSEKGEIFPCVYDKIVSIAQDKLYVVQKDKKYGVLDVHSNIVIPLEYDEICISSDRLFRAKKDGKCGVMDINNNVVVSFDYDNFIDEHKFNNGVTIFSKNGKWGLVSNENKVVLPFDYDNIYASDNYARIQKGKQQGIANRQGKIIIKPLYDDVGAFHGYIKVMRDEKYGLCDSTGKRSIPIMYDNIYLFYAENNVFQVERNGKAGLVNDKGKVLVAPIYDDIDIKNDGKTIYVKKKGKMGLVDKSGKIVIPLMYDAHNEIDINASDNLFAFMQNDKWGVVNNKNEIVAPFESSRARIMKVKNKTCIGIIKSANWGLLDSLGTEKIPIAYNYISNLPERNEYFVAQKESGGLFGIISDNNEVVCPFRYTKLNHSHGDIYKAWSGYNCGVINREGKELTPLKYDEIKVLHSGLYAGKYNAKWVVGNYNTGFVSDKKYDNVKYLSPNKLAVMIEK